MLAPSSRGLVLFGICLGVKGGKHQLEVGPSDRRYARDQSDRAHRDTNVSMYWRQLHAYAIAIENPSPRLWRSFRPSPHSGSSAFSPRA